MEPPTAHHVGLPPSSLSLTQQAVNAVRGALPMSPPQHVVPSGPPPLIRSVSPPMTESASPKPDQVIHSNPGRNGDIGPDEELLLKWDDHHKSFFELAEDLCHQELFIDVTLSCGEHNFPAHKLVLSVCSPYFRHLFLRNPCKHPIVVLKDVHFKYMKLLLMYMYRGEVSCPQEDLHGLLKTARSLQIRGLVELERKREAEGYLQNSVTGSPIKRVHEDRERIAQGDGASTTSCDIGPHSGDEFSLDEVRHRLHGQLDIQPISQVPQSSTHGIHPNTTWFNRDGEGQSTPPPQAHTTTGVGKGSSSGTGSDGGGAHSEEDAGRHQIVRHPRQRLKNEPPSNGQRSPHHWADNNGGVNHHNRASPLSNNIVRAEQFQLHPETRGRSPRAGRPPQPNSANNAAILAAAQAAGMPMSALDPADPMSSMTALLAAAQAHGKKSPLSIPSSLASLLPPNLTAPSSTSTSASRTDTTGSMPAGSRPHPGGPPGNGTALGNGDPSQAATMANLQLYYYMQKVASAGMGNPKERKECPICGKTLYDRSTWNRHMRIHTGEKPYPCQFCGRRFRTNYNKLGHEKKCPDRHAQDLANSQNAVNNSKPNENHSGEPPQKIMLNLNNQAVPVSSTGGGRTNSISGSQTSAPPTSSQQTAEYR